MSFWKMSNGEQATGNVTENDFAPVPKGWYPMFLEEVAINEWQGNQSIKIKARMDNNRVLFLSLKCWDDDAKKKDRAINVLVAMANAIGLQLPNGEPNDAWLAKMANKRVELLVDVWDFDGKQGNWLVNARAVGKQAAATKVSAQSKEETAGGGMDDDIPFLQAYPRAAWAMI